MEGFSVNTNIEEVNKRRLARSKKRMKKNIIIASSLLLCVIIVVVLLLLLPLKTVAVIETCVAKDTQNNKIVTYYENGKISTVENYYMDEINNVSKYVYYESGNLEKIENYFDDKLVSVQNFLYDKDALIEENFQGADGTLYSKTTYAVSDGKTQLAVNYDGENVPVTEISYNYKGKKLVSTEAVTLNNNFTVVTEFEYKKGNLVKEKITYSDGRKKEIKYSYDSFGNVISKTEEDNVYTLYSYTYNKKKVSVFK